MSTDPIPIRLKRKHLVGAAAKSIKITKAGNGKRPNKGLTGSFTMVPKGMGMGDKATRAKR